jgi:hypothetical protein
MTNDAVKKGEIRGDYLRKSWELTKGIVDVTPPLNDEIVEWQRWAEKADSARKTKIREVGVKWRKERRTGLTEAVQKRDQLYEDNKLKRYIQKILGTYKPRTGQVLLIRDPITGAPSLLTDPEEIKTTLSYDPLQNREIAPWPRYALAGDPLHSAWSYMMHNDHALRCEISNGQIPTDFWAKVF